MSIDLNNVKLAFVGDGQTASFDVNIEGVGPHRDGYTPFAAVTVKPETGERTTLQYGVDYTYVANGENANAAHNLFYNSFTIHLSEPLPAGVVLVVVRTTAVKSISRYTMDKTPPRQVELDFDNIIKILQEQGYDITELRSDLDAEIATRAEADAALTQADAALGKRLDAAEDGFEEILEECRDVLEEVKETQEIITDLSHGDLGGPVSTIYFTSDGVATSYTIPRPKIGRHILLMAFAVPSRRRIYFSETTPTDGSIVLTLAEPLPVSARFGVVFLRSVNAGDGDAVNTEFVHYQNEADTTWEIEHDLVSDQPRVVVKDSDGNITVGGEDWSRAAEKIVTITFCEPISGKATLSV